MPTASKFPDVQIPDVGIWDFIFSRNDLDYSKDKVIFQDGETDRKYTYNEVKQAATSLGAGLKNELGWKKGEVCALYTPNSIDTPVVTWGVHYAGGIVSPANPAYTPDELAFQLRDSGATTLMTQYAVLEPALQACKKAGLDPKRVFLVGDQRDPSGKHKHFTEIKPSKQIPKRADVDPDNDLAFLVYSSGTTGHPKGVMLSHRNIIANVLQNVAGEGPLTSQSSKDQPEGDTILAFLPFFHIYGLTVILHHAFYRGLKCVVMAKFDLETWCRIVQEKRISYGYVVPPVVLQLAKNPIVDKYDLSSIRMLNSGAAPLTKDLVDALYKRTKLCVKQGYGLSETSPTTHLQPWKDCFRTIGSVGLLLPNQTAKYMSEDGRELSAGETGELWVKGPNIFKGYLNNVEGTKNALTDDHFFKTGDVGYQDEEGNFYITDRVKELIKVKGFQVPPAELEGHLLAHPNIADVAVLGLPRPDLATEHPIAFVVVNPEGKKEASPALGTEIAKWLEKRVAPHKRLRGGVRFVDEIPKSASGKILRRVLKERLLKEGQKAKL